ALRWRQALQLCWEMRSDQVRPDIVAFGATIGACAAAARNEGAGAWQMALRLFEEAQLQGFPMSTQCLNNALQACVLSSHWETSLAIAQRLDSSDLVTSNLQLASLSLGRQWQQALQYLHTEMGQRGHKPDASTYNALPEDADDPDLEKLKDYLARCLMQDEFQPGDHVLDLHGMSLSSAKKAVRLALDDQTERVLLIVTGQGKHSSEKAVLKEGVASMLKQLHCRVRATEGGFYVSRTPAHAAAITRRNATRCSTA
ncbi:unnamed protein product, partial [Effrenium voratum]